MPSSDKWFQDQTWFICSKNNANTKRKQHLQSDSTTKTRSRIDISSLLTGRGLKTTMVQWMSGKRENSEWANDPRDPNQKAR
jgi:hypothetical protein